MAPGDEVRREDGGVPARQQADCEIEADHGVDRNHQRRRQAAQQQVRHLIAGPVFGRSAPAHGEHAEGYFLPLLFGAIAHGGKVGH